LGQHSLIGYTDKQRKEIFIRYSIRKFIGDRLQSHI
jgi:hypothetical protein